MSESARPVEAVPGTSGEGVPGRPLPAERIGKYEIVGLLGTGGMGAVYRAFDPFLERAVALKIVLPQMAEDAEHRQRFEREARAVARLTHPNVVTVFDLGYHTDGAPYIVMELLQGEDLMHLMGRGVDIPLAQKVSIVVQVLDGLGQAHKGGIVHRDVKPANVFITTDGAVKIMDFGIARLGSSVTTATGDVLGTAAYMSPEQVAGDTLDGRSDLFSVGTMLCELLSGHRPFEAESPLATMFRIAQKEPVLNLPPGPEHERFLPVLVRALAKDREKRYATSAEFTEALARCLDDPLQATRTRVEVPETPEPPGAGGEGPVGAAASPPGVPPAETQAFKAHALDAQAAGDEAEPAPSFDPQDLFRILRDVYVGGKSGRVCFTSSRGSRTLYAYEGCITHGTSDRDGEHFGEMLVRYGVITQGDLERARETKEKTGPALLGMGLLDRNKTEEALGLHVREIVFAILEESEGSLGFEELMLEAPETEVACSLSTGQVILEATRRVLDPEMVRKVLGDMDQLLVLSSNPVLRSQSITLTPTDGFVLSRIDGTLTARDVISLSPVSAEDTERSLFGLVCTGIVNFKKKTPTTRTRPHSRSEAPPDTGRLRTEGAAESPSLTPPPPTSATAHLTTVPVSGSEGPATSEEAEAAPPPAPATTEKPGESDAATRATPGEPEPAPAEAAEADIPADSAPAQAAPPDTWSSASAPDAPKSAPAGEAEAPPTSAPAVAPEAPPPAATEPRPGVNPASAIREAEGLFAERRYEDAVRLVEPVLAVVTGPLRARAAILLARGCMRVESRIEQAERVLLGLTGDDPECTPAYFFLGDLYRSRNEIARAREMYERVLELAPRHRGAAAELEALEAAPPA